MVEKWFDKFSVERKKNPAIQDYYTQQKWFSEMKER